MCDTCVQSGALVNQTARRNQSSWYRSADILFGLAVGTVMVVMMTLVFHRAQMQPPLALPSAAAWFTGFFSALTIPTVGVSTGLLIAQLMRRHQGYVVTGRTLTILGATAAVSLAGVITLLCVSF